MTHISIPSLSDRAMLTTLNISQWVARKYDRKVSAKATELYNASAEAGRFNKQLLPTKTLAEITRIASTARVEFYARTVPWLYDGPAMLSTLGYEAFARRFSELKEQWVEATDKFVSLYPDLLAAAPKELNGMYDPADYPPPDKIASKFAFSCRFFPVPQSADFRADIGDAQAAAIRQSVEQSVNEAMRNAVTDVFKRIQKTVGHMKDKLTAYNPEGERVTGIFRDSLVDNIKELVSLMPSLNIMDDPVLTALTDRMNIELCTMSAADLRENKDLRDDIALAADKILETVSDYI